MAEDKGGRAAEVLAVGGLGLAAGTALGILLKSRPAEAAPPEEKTDYLIKLMEQMNQSNVTIIELLEKLVAAQGGVPGVKVSVSTPWVSKDPEEIFNQAVRAAGTFFSDKMVDFRDGKRLVFKVESSLDQAVNIQLIGNIGDTRELATDIDGPFPCPANSNISIGLAWDDWTRYVGVRITVAVAPTAGILTIWAAIQE